MTNPLNTKDYRIEALGAAHDRGAFSCGDDALDRYLRATASQDVRRSTAVVHVLVPTATPHVIAGFYTLSASSVALTDLPDSVRRRLPRYPTIPVALIGRLATDLRFRGKKLGAFLLVDALARICHVSDESMGIFAVVVDAKNSAAANFYQHFGLAPFTDSPRHLYLPTVTARAALRDLGLAQGVKD